MGYESHKLPEWLDAVRQLATDAGGAILAIYNQDFDVTEKDDKSPLTNADMASHRLIQSGLKALTPDIPVLSEESGEISFETRSSWSDYWLIDPLDGTREFIKRNGEFTVNIALVHQHEIVLGVVYAPARGLSYYACRDCGAFKQEDGQAAQRITIREPVPEHPTIAGSRSHAGASLNAFLESVGPHELVSMGSSLKSCLVAEGTADIYPRFGPTSEWDTAAAQCVVEEAGGRLTDIDLEPLRYNTKDSLLNPSFLVIGDPAYNWSQHF